MLARNMNAAPVDPNAKRIAGWDRTNGYYLAGRLGDGYYILENTGPTVSDGSFAEDCWGGRIVVNPEYWLPVLLPDAEPAETAAPAQPKLPAIGAPFQGGFYAGQYLGPDGADYALIVAPKAAGESKLPFKNRSIAEVSASNRHDGMANSDAMEKADYPAARFCRSLRIGGFDDWYLPSQGEAQVIADNLMPGRCDALEDTAAQLFGLEGSEAFEPDAYWTSTEQAKGRAWGLHFRTGFLNTYFTDVPHRFRAIRKCPI